jgi:class 3 adenylate cyclase
MERHLAAILAADVVGNSGLMEQDEAGTLAARFAFLSSYFQAGAAIRRFLRKNSRWPGGWPSITPNTS